ncbi:Nose resistant-to-fluoxetine protein N-terminal domain-containing protein [Caenorhabditis elegans]|nr:Nose resistant-to-fluoxetine protein N-terminal domain-containing protein [Caenorhabditis elegans]CTQ86860.1 Nose resistant-to-fluoxetine protein N-terminal domain-containing protein [Caenorhabditis elegans]|eukprot:NP_001300161.1 O-ACyltransferase homolog [Caenorhabditis elegans]
MALLGELMAHPREVMEQLEKYKTSDLIAALGIHSFSKYTISEECHEELAFLGYGMIDVARHVKHQTTAAPSTMTDVEKTRYLIPMMDAAGKIGSGIARGHILSAGAFTECKSVSMHSTSLNRTIRGDYYRILFDIKMRPNSFNDSCQLPQIGVDICLPWSCRNEDLTDYFREALGATKELSPVCSVRNVNGRTPGFTFGTYVVVTLILSIIATSIVSCTVDYYFQNRRSKIDYERMEGSSNVGWKIFMAFSLYRNVKEIFKMKQCNKEGQVTSLNCIRTISTVWVILGHCAAMLILICTNPVDLLDFTKTYMGALLVNAYFAVDTFFFISAFLLSFLWFKQLQKQRKALISPGGWMMFYVHRIARLSPAYYIAILFVTFVYIRMLRDMPAFMSPAIQDDTCQQNYWLNLLYIENIVDTKNICYVISWYLATDLQLYLMSPILLLSFAIGGAVFGLFASVVALVASTAFNAYQIFFWYFPPTDYPLGPKDPRYNENERRYDVWNYYNPLIRCQIYIMGLVLGYFMRKVPKININPWVDRIMWVLSLGSMVFVVLVIQDYSSGDGWTPVQTALYSCFSRVLWGFAMSWIVISTYYRKGLIRDFMSLSFWTPLARLSFCAYLVHWMVLGYFFGRNHSELYFSTLSYFFLDTVIPVTALSFVIAIFWSSMFEIPFAKIEGLLLGRSGTPKANGNLPKVMIIPLEIPKAGEVNIKF